MLDQYESLRLAGRECEAALRALGAEAHARAAQLPLEATAEGDAAAALLLTAEHSSAVLQRRIGKLEDEARQLRALRKAQLPLVRAVAERLRALSLAAA